MTYTDICLGLLLAGLSAYLLFGGADFGAGAWHLLAHRRLRAPAPGRDLAVLRAQREVIEHAMGPVWEANHVWLIFVMVMTWTAFPPIFASIMTEYWVPLSLAALGIVIRGSAFVFWKAVPGGGRYALAFGISSALTPYCLGAVAGAMTAGRTSWLGPEGVCAGLLTTVLCSYLAAVYLTADARRLAGRDVTERFRLYALAAGVTVGVLALPGAVVLDVRSPLIWLSAVAGVVSLVLLLLRRYLAVRVTAALAAAAVLWGAADLSDLDFEAAAAHDAVLRVVLIALGAGGIILLPSLAWLYLLFQRDGRERASLESGRASMEPGGEP
jgi:cytochrome d ubiquinol oxidase subunit II